MENKKITLTLSALEMSIIREALRYGAHQVIDSDIPVFENYMSRDDTGKIVFDADRHEDNQDKAIVALELADTLDLIQADGADWQVMNTEATEADVANSVEVWLRSYKTEDFGTPIVREFCWRYVPKHSAMYCMMYTTVLEDCVMPLNTTVAVHTVPYKDLTDKNVVRYYTIEDLQNRSPIIFGDADIDRTIVEALQGFINYHG